MDTGPLEEQLNKLKAMEKEIVGFKSSIEELDRYHEAVQEAMVFDNIHTPYTMEVCYMYTLASLHHGGMLYTHALHHGGMYE